MNADKVSKELREALDNPRLRHRIVEAWRLRKKSESLGHLHEAPLKTTTPKAQEKKGEDGVD